MTAKMIFCRTVSFAIAVLMLGGRGYAATPWITPTPEELKMTSEPLAPGAPAIYLNYEETLEDQLRVFTKYVRMKVLNEEGRQYADAGIELADIGGKGDRVDEVIGRTIHPDGTVIPFTGKPYEKTMMKSGRIKYTGTVFTLPSVEVGSIIEYRYKVRWDELWLHIPMWQLQQDQFAKSVHFKWLPDNDAFYIFKDGSTTGAIRWLPMVPPNAKLTAIELPPVRTAEPQKVFEVTAADIKARPNEEFMPPITSLSYRVMFFYSYDKNGNEYWGHEAKSWSKDVDQFIGSSSQLKAFATSTAAGSATTEDKLKKLYAAVMEFDNTDFSRSHSKSENKVQGLKEVHTAEDILARKRGTGDELTMLFIGLARALGIKTYAMAVTNRDKNTFNVDWMSRYQLDDVIAIADVDGKEVYFDPGQKYCPAGHLVWKHSNAGGIRQSLKGAEISQSGGEDYKFSQISRAADLRLAADGSTKGAIFLTMTGNPAIEWRQKAAKSDETELKQQLEEFTNEMLPDGLHAEVQKIDQATAYEEPLKVVLQVQGSLGTATSKRMILPGDIFEAKSKPVFTAETREYSIYFPYEMMQRDGVRIVFPAGMTIEASPSTVSEKYQNDLIYSMRSEKTANSVTTRRDFVRNSLLFNWKEYAELKGFFNKIQAQDQQNVILQTPVVSAGN